MSGRKNRLGMKLWPVAPFLVWIRREFGLDRNAALSAFIGHVKACRMNMGADGWPSEGFVFANSRTTIKDLVRFVLTLGMRTFPASMVVHVKPSTKRRRRG